MKKIIQILLLVLTLSCASTNNRAEDLNYSLGSIKEVVKELLPAPLKAVSPNGREHYSDYFPLPSDYAKKSGYVNGKALERARAKVVVLGDRRPYSIEVEILREQLISGSYLVVGRVEEYEELLAKGIAKSLAKRHETTNLIDDFRPF